MNIRTVGIEVQKELVAEMAKNDGKVPVIEFADKVEIREMLGTDSGPREFIEKVTYTAYQGREAVPLVYTGIYRKVTDSNLPKSLTEEQFGPLQAVFLKHWEGGEVKFGALGAGESKTVSITTWATGLEYNEDIVEFNETWRVSEIAVAFGEAYNKLLNHLHLGPILTASYDATAESVALKKVKQEAGTAVEVDFNTSIADTLRDALQILPAGSYVIHNSADTHAINEAIAGDMHSDNSPTQVKSTFGGATYLAYDGDSVTVGSKTYDYAGVSAGELFFLVPKRQFVEYEKHGLRIDSDDGDLSRLVLAQVIGRTRRGVLATIGGKQGVVKVNLTA